MIFRIDQFTAAADVIDSSSHFVLVCLVNNILQCFVEHFGTCGFSSYLQSVVGSAPLQSTFGRNPNRELPSSP